MNQFFYLFLIGICWSLCGTIETVLAADNSQLLACYADLQNSVESLPDSRSVNGYQEPGIALIPDPKNENAWYVITNAGVFRQDFEVPKDGARNHYQITFPGVKEPLRFAFELSSNKGKQQTLLSYSGAIQQDCKSPCKTMAPNTIENVIAVIEKDLGKRIGLIAENSKKEIVSTVARKQKVYGYNATTSAETIAPKILQKYVKAINSCEKFAAAKTTREVSTGQPSTLSTVLTMERAELAHDYPSAMRQVQQKVDAERGNSREPTKSNQSGEGI